MSGAGGAGIDARFARLIEVLYALRAERGEIVLAYSGGLDSRFLAHAALLAGLDPLLVHVAGPHVPARESALAQDWAAKQSVQSMSPGMSPSMSSGGTVGRGARLRTLVCDPLEVPEVRANGKERCYFCKRELFTRLSALAAEEGGGRPVCLCDGSNLSDSAMYRPGMRALRELGVVSPLAEAQLDKPTIRELAGLTGLERPDQPSRPCLLTRLDYGLEPTPGILALLEEMEAGLEEILPTLPGKPFPSLPDFRVRYMASATGNEGRFALQLSETLTQAQQEALAVLLTARGLPLPELLPDQKISGYFDRRA